MHMMEGYALGVNFGLPGKLSRDGPIWEDDFKRIAGWGMDHVRINMDHKLLMEDDRDEYKEEGFAVLDQLVEWAARYGLNVIMDLHTCPGYHFMYDEYWKDRGTNTLLKDKKVQDRFVSIWEYFSKRYASQKDNVAFELLNEIVFDPEDQWNKLVKRTVAAIRALNPGRIIVYGGKYYNNINFLKDLYIFPDDDRIYYTYHYYLPNYVTHQNASWHLQMMQYKEEIGEVVEYPGKIPRIEEFLNRHPEYREYEERYIGAVLNKDFMYNVDCRPAVEFLEKTGKPLYCGEFGCYSKCPRQTRVNYLRDLIGFLKEYGIGIGYFNYKGDGFGLVLSDGSEDREILDILTKK